MNSTQRKLAQACAAALLFAGLAACDERAPGTTAKSAKPNEPSPSAVVIGQAPADPKGDPPGTTPVAPNTSDVSKAAESVSRPIEGDNHSYSTVAPATPQKADGKNSNGNGDRP